MRDALSRSEGEAKRWGGGGDGAGDPYETCLR